MPDKPSALYQQAVADGRITFDDGQWRALMPLDRMQQALLKPVRKSPLRLLRPRRPAGVPGAYLWGGVGSGKTLLMDLFYHSLPAGVGKRIHFHRYMQAIHQQKSQLGEQQQPLARIARQAAARYRVLCLDEFAVTDITDAMLLSGLLKYLFAQRVTLLTTSNIEPDNLYAGGLQRERFLPAIALLKQHTQRLQVDSGTDYRMAFLHTAPTYLTPLNAQQGRLMQQTFARFCDQCETSKTMLDIGGRDVAVVATGSGVVWFEADVLCEAPRSKTDYIELSKRFHTVFVANLTTFDKLRDDAARRFIELIDELYDRSVNLILSADAPADKLYRGKRLTEPFQRTVSRLWEMQSDDYLARPHLA